ncbi:MAG: shikimate dehydrogenase [Bacteroidales bacterium]|nr:shikimate dehydrogenase [Bacteroidales bacterium]
MRTYGLIGKSLIHTKSPEIFGKIFADNNLHNCEYKLFPLNSVNELHDLLRINQSLAGLNVTIPFKTEIIGLLDEIDPIASKTGAVNTVKIHRLETKIVLKGYNTDTWGFEKAFTPYIRPYFNKALIIGTGGAAKAVAYVLTRMNISFSFVSRIPKGENQLGYNDLSKKIMESSQVIINTTPLGMFPEIENYPEIPYQHIVDKHLCFDLIYNPEETLFLKKGKDKGATITNGWHMLKYQAEKAWDIWNLE